MRGALVMIKYLFPLLIILFTASHAFAEETANDSNKQLQEIINLFESDQRDNALSQLELQKIDLVASVRGSQDPEQHMLLGRAFFYAEMDTEARELLNSALILDPSLSEAHFFLGVIYRYADDIDGAVRSFRNAIEINNEEEKYFVELGRTLEVQGDETSASTAYQNALALNKNNFDANFNLATIYSSAGNYDNAEQLYLLATQQKPGDIDTHYNLGQLYQTTKQHKLAIEKFGKVVDLNPNDWRAIAKLVQENEAIDNYTARDAAIENIYEVWRTKKSEELIEQKFYIREQREIEEGKVFVLEYFELEGTRPRKYVFKLRDKQTGDIKFDISLGSYEATTEFARSQGSIGKDERYYHVDGYAPNGSHYTYAFFNSMPPYAVVKEIALKALVGEYEVISSTTFK